MVKDSQCKGFAFITAQGYRTNGYQLYYKYECKGFIIRLHKSGNGGNIPYDGYE